MARNYAAIGRIGGLMTAARHDPKEITKAAHEGYKQRFLNMVDEASPGLEEHERERRAFALMRAHMAKLNLLRWKGKRRKGGNNG